MEQRLFKRSAFIKITKRSIKLPLILFFTGCLLIGISFTIDTLFKIPTRYTQLFTIIEKSSNVFIVLAVIAFIYKLSTGIMRYYEKKFYERHKMTSLILSSMRKGFRLIFILISLNFIIIFLSPAKLYSALAKNTIDTFIIIAIGWMAIQVLQTIETVLYQYMLTLPATEHHRGKALYTKMHIFRNIATVAIAIMTLAAVLMSFSSVRNIGISLLASAGFLTAIIGIAAQKTLFSLFSGIQIAFSQVIKIGDLVLVDQESGLIEEITFTFVTLKLGDRRRLVVPITRFIENPFENWSRDSESIRSSFLFYVDYHMPIDPLRNELDAILNESTYWDKIARKLQISNLQERSVEIRIQVSAKNADDIADLKAEVKERMLAFMRTTYPDYLPKIQGVIEREPDST